MPDTRLTEKPSQEQLLSSQNTDRQGRALSIGGDELQVYRRSLQDVRTRADMLVNRAKVLTPEQLDQCKIHMAAAVKRGEKLNTFDAAVALKYLPATEAERIKREAWIESFVSASAAVLESMVSNGFLDEAAATEFKNEQIATFRASDQLIDLIATARARGHLPLLLTSPDGSAADDLRGLDKSGGRDVGRHHDSIWLTVLHLLRVNIKRAAKRISRIFSRRRKNRLHKALEAVAQAEIEILRQEWKAQDQKEREDAAAAWDAAEKEREKKVIAEWQQAEASRQLFETEVWDQAEGKRRAAEQAAWDKKQEEQVRIAVQTADDRAMAAARENLNEQEAAWRAEAAAKMLELRDVWLKEEDVKRREIRQNWVKEEAAKREAVNASWTQNVTRVQEQRHRQLEKAQAEWRDEQQKIWLRDYGPEYYAWSAEWRELVAHRNCDACSKPFLPEDVKAYVCGRSACGAVYHVKCITERFAKAAQGRAVCAGRHGTGHCSSTLLADFALVDRERSFESKAGYPGLTLSPAVIADRDELQLRLNSAVGKAGQIISLNSPFQPLEVPGAVSIRGSLALDGAGVTLHALHGPVLAVEADNVVLKNLRLYVTAHPMPAKDSERCALFVKPGCKVRLENVEVRGEVIGVPGEEGKWDYVTALDLGQLKRDNVLYRKIVEITAPVACSVKTTVPGITFSTTRLKPGKTSLEVDVNGNHLPPGALLHGDITLETANVRRHIRITARITALDAGAAPPVIIPSPAGVPSELPNFPHDLGDSGSGLLDRLLTAPPPPPILPPTPPPLPQPPTWNCRVCAKNFRGDEVYVEPDQRIICIRCWEKAYKA